MLCPFKPWARLAKHAIEVKAIQLMLCLFFPALFPPSFNPLAACCGKSVPCCRSRSFKHSRSKVILCERVCVSCAVRVQVCASGSGFHRGQLGEYRCLKLCSFQRLYHHSHRQTDQRPARQGRTELILRSALLFKFLQSFCRITDI